jgi:phage protein D/phage baseplate assembly protein gpV
MAEEFAAKPRIEVDGAELAPELDARLELTIVDDSLFLPDMFVLRFRNDGNVVFEQNVFTIGSQVAVIAAPLGEAATEPLIRGEVTSIETELGSRGNHAVIRGYDHSHRLHRGRKTTTFHDVTDSDVVRTVTQTAGIGLGRIDETATPHEHVSQANVTDWDFLRARAREVGFEVLVADGKLDFKRPTRAAAAPQAGDLASAEARQLVLGANLESFHARLTSAEQVKEVEVRGWDDQRKEAVVAHADAQTTSAQLDVTPAELASKFGNPTFVSVDRPFSTQAEVDGAAKALAEEIASVFAEVVEGVAKGDPKLKAGTAVSIGLTGPFDGRYTITASRHVFDERGYKTHFVVSGRQERSLLGLTSLGATNGAGQTAGRVGGVVIGQVTDVRDPEQQGRVRLRFPWLSDTFVTDFCRVVHAGAGKERGFLILPEVDDEVLVAFEHGDIRRPFVLGGLYNGVDQPKGREKVVDESGAVDFRFFVSRQGHAIVFADDDRNSGINLGTAGEKELVSLNAVNHRVRITSGGEIVIEGGAVTISGSTISILGGSSIELKAPQISIQGESQVSVNGGALATVEAALVRIN